MSQINRAGTFRFQIIDAGIGQTKNGFPQWIAQLQAVEYYDEDTEQWIDWSEYDEREITCYIVLFGGDGNATLSAKQLQKALNWSGASFEELEYEYVGDIIFQGRVEEHTYEGITRLQVNWIDHYDAEPGRTLQKLDKDKVKQLNAKYATKLRELSGGLKPKSVPTIPTVDRETVKAAVKEKIQDQKERGKAAEAKAAKRENKGKLQPPKPPKPLAAGNAANKAQAWINCCQDRNESVDNKQLESTWHEVVDMLGGEDIVEENNLWAKVQDRVLAKVGKLPI